MKNLYGVGENVIVFGETIRGEHRIEFLDNEQMHCSGCNKIQQRYWLEDIKYEGGVCECCLRKKQDPGGSFEAAVDMLKIPNKQPVMAEQEN